MPFDPVVEAPPTAVTGEPNAAAVRSMWSTVRDKVREIVRAVEGDTLVLSHELAAAGPGGWPNSATPTSSAKR